MALEECGAGCEWRRVTHRGHKRFSGGKCAQLQIQEQNYRFLPTTNQITSNTGNQNMKVRSNMLFTMGMVVLVGLIVGHRGLWRVKCQIIGMLLVIGIPPNQGEGQWPQKGEQP